MVARPSTVPAPPRRASTAPQWIAGTVPAMGELLVRALAPADRLRVVDLLAAAAEVARELALDRAWLVTTNDNLDALRFYQRRGMRITAVAAGAVDAARALKPAIPAIGAYGIELHDELTLELRL